MGRLRRILFLATTGVVVFLYFILKSRHPQLNEKALMAQSGSVSDLLSVWPILEVKATDPFWQKVFYTTVNWLNDNKTGMAIGVFLGAIFLTIFRTMKPVSGDNRWLNSLYGFIIGTPMGVCVNCAAPIFKGVLRSQRVETAFSMMFSSPTMNVIVLTMTFSLFPFYMGVVKILLTFLVVFLCVPLLSKLFAGDQLHDLRRLEEKGQTEGFEPFYQIEEESWIQSLWGAVKSFAGSLFFIATRTVPFMFLAGFLGALLTYSLPAEMFLAAGGGFLSIAGLSVVAVLLPLPMAFDIMLANALFQAGLPPEMALVLLCGFGIYSIFSFFIVWQSASAKWALSVLALLSVLVIGLGLIGKNLHREFYVAPNVRSYLALKENFGEGVATAIDRESVVVGVEKEAAPARPFQLEKKEKNLQIFSRSLEKKTGGESGAFVKKEGHEIGLNHGFRYGIRDYPDPFWIGRGTASADFDGDGWVDVAFGTDIGISLFRNRGGFFVREKIENSFLAKQKVYALAFVDFNNDGWLDLFFSTYVNGNYILLNEKGSFIGELIPVPNRNAVVTVSPAFADLDGNGFVDILNGNMALGVVTGFFHYDQRRSNSIIYNHRMKFVEEPLDHLSGETMSTLTSDINNDGHTDIYMGNDFIVPDYIYFGSPSGKWRLVDGSDKWIEKTPFYSMSTDSGDFNNDLQLDLLTTGTVEFNKDFRGKEIDGKPFAEYSKEKSHIDFCQDIKDSVVQKNCQIIRQSDFLVQLNQRKNLEVERCQKHSDVVTRQACLLSTMWMIITNNASFSQCEKDFSEDPLLLQTCQLMNLRGKNYLSRDFITDSYQRIPQSQDSFLYQGHKDGSLSLLGKEKFSHPGGWTWNNKFGDFDNDGWLDIFGAEGVVRVQGYGFNTFFHNQQGQSFELKPFSANVVDDFRLFSFVRIDYDNDGDLDIVGNSSAGPVQVYENQMSGNNHSVSIDLRDHHGNHFGLGAKVYLHLEGGLTLLREVKASGGYQSFDGPAVHFGVGSHQNIEAISIHWLGGEKSYLNGPFSVDRQYQIRHGI